MYGDAQSTVQVMIFHDLSFVWEQCCLVSSGTVIFNDRQGVCNVIEDFEKKVRYSGCFLKPQI